MPARFKDFLAEADDIGGGGGGGGDADNDALPLIKPFQVNSGGTGMTVASSVNASDMSKAYVQICAGECMEMLTKKENAKLVPRMGAKRSSCTPPTSIEVIEYLSPDWKARRLVDVQSMSDNEKTTFYNTLFAFICSQPAYIEKIALRM